MPVVFRQGGFRFQFYSNEGNRREPVHIHAVKDGTDAKFWLRPHVRLAYNDGHSVKSIRMMLTVIEAHRAQIERDWHDFFGDADQR